MPASRTLPEVLCADGSHQRHILWYILHSRYIYSDPPQKLHRTDNGKSLLLPVLPSDCETGRGRSLPVLFHLLSPESGVWMYRNFPRKYCFIQLHKITTVSSYGQGTVFMYITMKGNRTLPSCCDRIDGKSRSCIHITADEDIRLRGLIGQFICSAPPFAVSSDPGYPAYYPHSIACLPERLHASR